MANQEHVKKLLEGVDTWNQWRNEHREILPDLTGAILTYATLTGANLTFANLTRAKLRGAVLVRVDLTSADLTGADLTDVYLIRANLTSADLTSATLLRAKPRDAKLMRADLTRADLTFADLTQADLTRATLTRANLMSATLTDATLTRANLTNADLTDANLRGADLTSATLTGVNLTGAGLTNADLTDANLDGTVFSVVNLSQTKGLLELQHANRSTINLYRIKLPQDGSALHFLRGAGVPDEWIDFYRTTMQLPIQYHSCFISYSSDDYEVAKRLHADLQNEGVRCWFAPHNLVPGDHFREKIDQAIHMQDKLLLILSQESVESEWVKHEVRRALNREVNQHRTVLFPIRIDESMMQSSSTWAQDLKENRHIGDFTQWKNHDVYKQKFQILLKQLKNTGAIE